MDINSATPDDEDAPSGQDSGSPASGLSTKQRAWARAFVILEGNATAAALEAGYSASSAHISGRKNCLNSGVMEYVRILSLADVRQHLPAAIGALVRVATKGEDESAVVKAADKLCLYGGLAPPKAPLVDMRQININGQSANALIDQVWKARAARLGQLSGIPLPMADTMQGGELIEATALAMPSGAEPATDRGGVSDPGSRAPHASLPGYSPSPCNISTGPDHVE